MSWSVSFFGKPEKVAEALEAYSEKLNGVSKIEYDKALPNMVGLVKQNFGTESQLIKFMGNGHGSIVDGVQQYGTCNVTIESAYGLIV